MSVVCLQDVLASYEGEVSDDKHAWLSQKVEEAERILFAQCPTARHRVESDDDFKALFRDCVVRAVLRVVRDESPMYRSETEGNYSYSKNMLVASGDVWFPDKELDFLGCRGGLSIGTARLGISSPYGVPSRNIARGRWY